MTTIHTEKDNSPTPLYRLDVGAHDELKGEESVHYGRAPLEDELGLPEPVFPQRNGELMTRRQYQKHNALRTYKTWGIPYVKSLWHRGELRPIIAYLFTEYKCNLDCHYCWSFNNKIKGMSEASARRSLDWLHDTGCRVLALMGGEPLLRPPFIHKVVDYAAKKGFFVYLATNGRLLKPAVCDRLGDAGIAAINLAIDSMEFRPELPKALDKIRPYFDHMAEAQHRYGYLMMVNINITRINMQDVKDLTEFAHERGIGTDYHINESPMMEAEHFKHMENNSTYLTPEDWPKVDALLDYLADKHRQGYKMPNPANHFQSMKDFMRGGETSWPCRAGQNSLIIRTDGSLAPCFPMYGATYDWGKAGSPKFDVAQLTEMKKSCNKHCLSTLNYILGHCYNSKRVITWAVKQALHGFRGATGSL